MVSVEVGENTVLVGKASILPLCGRAILDRGKGSGCLRRARQANGGGSRRKRPRRDLSEGGGRRGRRSRQHGEVGAQWSEGNGGEKLSPELRCSTFFARQSDGGSSRRLDLFHRHRDWLAPVTWY